MVKLTKDGILRINFRNSPYNDFRLQCNFKCSYCFQNCLRIKQIPFTIQHYQQTKLIWNELAKINDQIFVRVNFNGETLIDEWAKKCVFYINNIHNVKVLEIITNNSINPRTYINNLDLTKTTFNCSFHPEFISIQKFIENSLYLRKMGYEVLTNIVCVPQIIKLIPKIFEIFRKNKLDLKLQGFITNGFKYLGKQYPKDFNKNERQILKQYFYSLEEYEYMIDLKRTNGLDCYAGVDMINIFLDGTIKRCFTGEIGNFSQNRMNIKISLSKIIRKKFRGFFNNTTYRKFSNKANIFIRKDKNIFDLISGNINLKSDPYPCHEDSCACYAHFIGLKEFRKKFQLSEKFVDSYIIKDHPYFN